uniref:ARAD1C24134p n=1 Tax=Blastobotrys adeninivorans TaxID=409370 RepID=A0A060T1W2_BLAAD
MIPGCTVHQYARRLVAIEHPTKSGNAHKRVVVFVGGLGDGLFTVPYVTPMAEELDNVGWGVVQVLLRDSYLGWGTGSLAKDAQDITKAISYLYSTVGKESIVLMGHSTGTQDAMYYLTQQYKGDNNDLDKRPKLSGVILQAPVSDREGAYNFDGKMQTEENVRTATKLIEEGRGDHVLPPDFSGFSSEAPVSAERFVSLTAVRGGDDFFSSDLTEQDFEKTFGQISTKLLVLYSGKDEFVPKWVDKQKLVDTWKSIAKSVWSEYGGVVQGARHAVDEQSDDGAQQDLINRVVNFVKTI